jgi:hypothetical protein
VGESGEARSEGRGKCVSIECHKKWCKKKMPPPPVTPSTSFDQAYGHPWQYLLNHEEDVVRVFSETPATIVALMVLVATGAWLLYWLIHRGKINGLNGAIVGLQGETGLLERQKNDLESKVKDLTEQIKSPVQQWVADLTESDRTTIDIVVKALECKASWDLEASSPFVSFRFTVFNGAIWTIILDRVEGHILYGKRQLKGAITLSASDWKPVDIPHGYIGSLEIFQWLTGEETLLLQQDWQKNSGKLPAFHFKHLKIIISGGANAERVIPKTLRLHDVSQVTMR